MKLKFALLFIGCALMTSVVLSHSGATGIVKERMDAMSDMGDKSKLVADMFKGKTDFDRAALVDAADAFAGHASKMAELFPDTKHSRSGSKTEALPVIWDDWDGFNKIILEFSDASESLKETAAKTTDAGQLKKAFFKTTKSCSSCHKRFRKPKK